MENAVPEMAGHYFSFRRRWQSLTTWNKTARPWWEEQYRKWSLSPWSEVCAREWIAQFREAHARRDLLECTKLIWKMINDIGESRYPNGFDPVLGPTMHLWGCIASLMMASIPVMAGEVSWKGPRPNIWMHPSMSAAVQWTKPLTLHPMVLDSYVKSNDTKPGPWTHPSEGLSAFWTRFCPMGTAYAIPHGWLLACYNTFQTLWANHHTAKVQGQWADFNFQIPEYDDQWGKLTVGTGVNVQYYNLPVCNWMSCHAPTGVEAAFYIPSPPSSPGSNNAAAPNWQTQARSSTRQFRKSASQSRGKLLYPLHFSTGEVGNNMNDEDFWVIESDGDSGYDIFSISELCLQMGFPTAEMIRRELITLSPLGPKLREDGHPAADQIRGELNQSGQKIGKLLLPRTVEYISEYDGRGGMPMWIIISTTVYDITRFTFGTQKEKAQLTENLGGRPNSLPDDPDVYDDLLQRLFLFRCALFEGRKAPKKTMAELPPFSPAMLSWHDNPTSGMYIAVDGIIYNVANYVDRHPGGRDILGQALGRAASNFHDFHAPDTMADYAELAVGRLVPDIALAQLRDHQVAIHDWVFDLERLDTEDDAWVLPVLAHLCGKDASEAIRNRDATADALVHVYDRRKEAIVAHIAPGEVGEIPVGEVARHNDPHSFHGAWVMVDGYVFDVTTLMLHGSSIHGVELPHMWAGRELRDDRLRKWLQEHFPHRVIGRVVAGEARPEPTVEELLTSRIETEQDKIRDELRRRIWGIEKDDETCGGRIKFCGGRKRGCGRGRGAAPGWGPSKGRKRAATDADGGDVTRPAVKRRG
ncbi:hypothetical protein PG993_003688 [Apiospora rasikravindrae]|uniref:Cytochrome b5 heme-binding domain-containing protein n=1 Tax=Apiospora rasikravindrae TaxID=990691 RepID=A0ABR1U082_9PEZI